MGSRRGLGTAGKSFTNCCNINSVKQSRREPRIPVAFTASCESARRRVRGACTNLSLGGAFLDGVQLPVGFHTTVTIEVLGRGELKAAAEVRRHQVSPRGMGVQFARLDLEQVTHLQLLCRRDN